MVKVCVLQADNRPSLYYLLKTKEVNKKMCNILGYEYIFFEFNNKSYPNIHPATAKIYIVNDFLQKKQFDILIFLDSDAWIQNAHFLKTITNNLINNEKIHGCFSRDPYVKRNTFINSGSFIIKNNDFTKKMYNSIFIDFNNNNKYHNCWPYDQYYISKYIFENKDHFVIFVPDILNTPIGKALRHNWWKDKRMYNDLHNLISLKNEDIYDDKIEFIETQYYDNECFPNTINGYEYKK